MERGEGWAWVGAENCDSPVLCNDARDATDPFLAPCSSSLLPKSLPRPPLPQPDRVPPLFVPPGSRTDMVRDGGIGWSNGDSGRRPCS